MLERIAGHPSSLCPIHRDAFASVHIAAGQRYKDQVGKSVTQTLRGEQGHEIRDTHQNPANSGTVCRIRNSSEVLLKSFEKNLETSRHISSRIQMWRDQRCPPHLREVTRQFRQLLRRIGHPIRVSVFCCSVGKSAAGIRRRHRLTVSQKPAFQFLTNHPDLKQIDFWTPIKPSIPIQFFLRSEGVQKFAAE